MIHPIRHFRTITHHKKLVLDNAVRCGIPLQGLVHDLSKYSPMEFVPGMRFYQGMRSPNERERELYGCSHAWMHHKGRNRHHFEYWTDVNPATKTYEPVEMPLKYIKEMFCDRVAASKNYKGDAYTDASPLEYYLGGQAREKMHPKTAYVLEKWLRMLAERGEAATFAHIRSLKKIQWRRRPDAPDNMEKTNAGGKTI